MERICDILIIQDDDSVNPKTSITLSGTAKLLAGLRLRAEPTNGLAFGHVDKGADAVLPFEVVNNGTDECLVNALQISAGSSSAFSLPDYLRSGAATSVIIEGSSSLEVQVRFAPTTQQANFAGTVAFTISNKSRQHQAVQPDRQQLVGLPPDPAEPAGLRGRGFRSR